MKKFIALSLSDVAFIMLVIEQEKFLAQLSWAWKKFYNLGACTQIYF